MNHVIKTLVILTAIIIAACSKQRTCSCTSKYTTTLTTKPRSSGSTTTTVILNESTDETTYSKITKNDLIKFKNCVSTYSEYNTSYTTTVFSPSITSVSGFTFIVSVPETGDEDRRDQYETSCEIK